jgi:hypothetical protein
MDDWLQLEKVNDAYDRESGTGPQKAERKPFTAASTGEAVFARGQRCLRVMIRPTSSPGHTAL